MALADSGIRLLIELWVEGDGDPAPGGDETQHLFPAPAGATLRRVQISWPRLRTGAVADDVAVTTFHLAKFEDDEPATSWDGSDFTAAKARFQTWWSAIDDYYRSNVILAPSIKFYRDGPGVSPPQPPVFSDVLTGNGAAGSGSSLPPQVALTVTHKTAVRRRWGRNYLPAPTAAHITNYGSVDSSIQAAVAAATAALFEGLSEDDLRPVVWSPTKNRAYGIREVQVDDLYDVQRSRRWREPASRVVEDGS